MVYILNDTLMSSGIPIGVRARFLFYAPCSRCYFGLGSILFGADSQPDSSTRVNHCACIYFTHFIYMCCTLPQETNFITHHFNKITFLAGLNGNITQSIGFCCKRR